MVAYNGKKMHSKNWEYLRNIKKILKKNLSKFNLTSAKSNISFYFIYRSYLAREEAAMLPFNVFAETHLQQGKSHM